MDQLNDSIIFTFHILLFAAKLWLITVIISEIKLLKGKVESMKMIVFSTSHVVILALAVVIAMFEFWFLSNFFNPVALEIYEEINILDQIALTALVVQFLKGGKLNG